ncbi:signal peptidase I [soil metagenome]
MRGYAEALVVAFLIVTFAFNTVGVVGSSMRPNLNGGVGSSNVAQSLLTGDRVFIPKYDTWLRRLGVLGDYRRGNIVIVREPANAPHAQIETNCFLPAKVLYQCRPFFIKRVIGVPGDHIRLEGGQVYVNDVAVDQSFITATGEIQPEPVDFPVVTQEDGEVTGFSVGFEMQAGVALPSQLPLDTYYPDPLPVADKNVQLFYGSTVAALEPVPQDAPTDTPFVLDLVVPPDHYFVMGDNRSPGGSEDSKYFGPVPALAVAGKATAVIWPPRRDDDWNWRSLGPPAAFAAIPNAPQP